MSAISGAYNHACDKSQHFLESHCPVTLPGGILRSITRSFVISFIASTILSGGNVGVGAIGGGIGALAAVIDVVARVALQQIQNGLSKCLGKPKRPLAFEGRVTADIIGLTGALLCADVAGLVKPLYTACILISTLWQCFVGSQTSQELPTHIVIV